MQLHHDFNRRLGIGPTMRLCERVNRWRHRSLENRRQELYRQQLAALLQEHDGFDQTLPGVLMRDGYAFDRSRSLPHLEQLLAEAEEVIAQRGGQDRSRHLDAQQPWFYPLHRGGDAERYPSFLNFALNSALIATVAHELGSIPYLSVARPPAFRLMESNSRYDTESHLGPRESQMFHLDIHSRPLLYVLVLLRDTDLDSGPWHFLPASTSARLARQIRYQARGVDYRVADAVALPRIDPGEIQVFTGKAGDILYIDSSRCFHYGSRQAVVPRYQMMYSFTGAVRSDFFEDLMPLKDRPLGPQPSRLRRLVLSAPGRG